MAEGLRVWIDQDLCTGDGLCADIVPEIFEMHSDSLAYVKEEAWPDIYNGQSEEPLNKKGEGMAAVPDSRGDKVHEAAEDCPGECIFIEAL